MPESNAETKKDPNFVMQISVNYKCRHCGADNLVINDGQTEFQCQNPQCGQISPTCDLIFWQ